MQALSCRAPLVRFRFRFRGSGKTHSAVTKPPRPGNSRPVRSHLHVTRLWERPTAIEYRVLQYVRRTQKCSVQRPGPGTHVTRVELKRSAVAVAGSALSSAAVRRHRRGPRNSCERRLPWPDRLTRRFRPLFPGVRACVQVAPVPCTPPLLASLRFRPGRTKETAGGARRVDTVQIAHICYFIHLDLLFVICGTMRTTSVQQAGVCLSEVKHP